MHGRAQFGFGIDLEPSTEKSGEQGECEEKDDEHARARNQSELRDAAIIRGHEDVKADGGGQGAEDQGGAHLARGLPEGTGVIVPGTNPIGIAGAQVDAEIRAEADEEDREGDGERIQGADGRGGEGGGPNQPRQQGEQGRDHDACGPQCSVENRRDQEKAEDPRHPHVPGDADHFVVVECRVARDANANPALGGERQFPGGLTDCRHGAASREDVGVVQDRVDDDDSAGGDIQGGVAKQKFLPGNGDGVFFPGFHRGLAEAIEDLGPIGPLILLIEGVESLAHDAGEVGDAGILFELGEQGLDPRHLIREGVEFVDALVEQPVAFEEFAAAGEVGLGDDLGLVLQARRQVDGRVPGEFRRGPIDDDEDRLLEVGEFLDERLVGFSRGQVRGNQAHVVRVDPQGEGGVDPEHGGQGEDRGKGGARSASNEIHPTRQKPGEHSVDSSLHTVKGPAGAGGAGARSGRTIIHRRGSCMGGAGRPWAVMGRGGRVGWTGLMNGRGGWAPGWTRAGQSGNLPASRFGGDGPQARRKPRLRPPGRRAQRGASPGFGAQGGEIGRPIAPTLDAPASHSAQEPALPRGGSPGEPDPASVASRSGVPRFRAQCGGGLERGARPPGRLPLPPGVLHPGPSAGRAARGPGTRGGGGALRWCLGSGGPGGGGQASPGQGARLSPGGVARRRGLGPKFRRRPLRDLLPGAPQLPSLSRTLRRLRDAHSACSRGTLARQRSGPPWGGPTLCAQ